MGSKKKTKIKKKKLEKKKLKKKPALKKEVSKNDLPRGAEVINEQMDLPFESLEEPSGFDEAY